MADGPLQLMVYRSTTGPVAYDAMGRTYPARQQAAGTLEVDVRGPFTIVEAFPKGSAKKVSGS